MSVKSLRQNHLNFESNIKDLIKYGLEIVNENSPYINERNVKKFKTILLESLLLRTCAHWENF